MTKNVIKPVLGVLAILLIFFLWNRLNPEKEKLEKSECFTYALDYTFVTGDDGAKFINYTYEVKGHLFKGTTGCYLDKNAFNGLKLKVQYVCEKPNNSRIMLDSISSALNR